MSGEGATGIDYVTHPNCINANAVTNLTAGQVLPLTSAATIGSPSQPFAAVYATTLSGASLSANADLDFVRFPHTGPYSAKQQYTGGKLLMDNAAGGALNVEVTGNLLANTLSSTGSITAGAQVASTAAAGTAAFQAKVTAESFNRAELWNDGSLRLGGGSLAVDTRIRRTAAAAVTIDDAAGGSAALTVATVNAALTGNVTGNLTGDVTGNVTGNLTGNVTGNLTGNVTATSIATSNITSAANLSITPGAGNKVSFDCRNAKVKMYASDASPAVVFQTGEAGTIDTYPGFELGSNGGMTWGTNSAAWDVGMGRASSKTLTVFDSSFASSTTALSVGTVNVQGINTQSGSDITLNSKNLTNVGTINGYTLSGSGSGDVVGPSSSTANAIARFDGTTGKLLKSTTMASLTDLGNLNAATVGTLAPLSTDVAMGVSVVGDTIANRLGIYASGNVVWSTGAAAGDVRLYRTSAGNLTIDNAAGGAATLTVATANITTLPSVNSSSVTVIPTSSMTISASSVSIGSNCTYTVDIASAGAAHSTSGTYARSAAIASAGASMNHLGSGTYSHNAVIAANSPVISSGTGSGLVSCNLVTGGSSGFNSISRGSGSFDTTDCFTAGYSNSIASASSATTSACFAIGHNNTITQGTNAILIGANNNTTGTRNNSIAIGNYLSLNADGAVLLGDSNTTVLTAGPNTCSARFANGYYFTTNAAATVGITAGANATSWSAISDIRTKNVLSTVDGDRMYEAVKQLPVFTYEYKHDDSKTLRIGTSANLMNALFADCESPVFAPNRREDGMNMISSADLGYVTLAALQTAMKRIEVLEARIAELTAK